MIREREKSCIETFAFAITREKRVDSPFLCWLDTGNYHQAPDALLPPYLIEHSSFDSVKKLRENNVYFENIIKNLDESMKFGIYNRYHVDILYRDTGKRMNLESVNRILEEWFEIHSESFPEGKTIPIERTVDGRDFKFLVRKNNDEGAPGIYFSRISVQKIDATQTFTSIFSKKSEKLRKWQTDHPYAKIILMECEDILLSYPQLIKGLERFDFNKHDHIHAVWLCETTHHQGGVIRLYTNIYTGEYYNFDCNLGAPYAKGFRGCRIRLENLQTPK